MSPRSYLTRQEPTLGSPQAPAPPPEPAQAIAPPLVPEAHATPVPLPGQVPVYHHPPSPRQQALPAGPASSPDAARPYAVTGVLRVTAEERQTFHSQPTQASTPSGEQAPLRREPSLGPAPKPKPLPAAPQAQAFRPTPPLSGQRPAAPSGAWSWLRDLLVSRPAPVHRVEPQAGPSRPPVAVPSDARAARGAPSPPSRRPPPSASGRASRPGPAGGGAGKGGGGFRLLPRITGWMIVRGMLTLVIWGAVLVLGMVAWFAYDMPPMDEAAALARTSSVTVEAMDGSVIATYGEQQGEQVPVAEMPPWLPGAVTSIEDRKFYDHFGVDPLGILRALYVNSRAGRLVQGGSTITQQAAKNLFLSQERTLKRKIQEMLIAFWLEARYSKDQILTMYLNRVYFGAGTYGVEAAAQRYFGVSARQVTPYQAAVLAGLLKAPSRYNPQADAQAARERAAVVLRTMVETGVLSQAQATDAESTGAGRLDALAAAARGRFGRAFADWVMDRVDEYVGRVSTDLVIRTTVDPRIQAAAEDALPRILADEGPKKNISQGAVVIMSPDGAVRAIAGGRDYTGGGFNHATQARRQPGSSFKPFLYLTAVEAGMRPDDMVLDAPISIGTWSPENFDQKFRGTITLREAVARSINTVAVRVMQEVGVKRVIATARRMGVEGDFQPNLSLALGTGETTLLSLVGGYTPFANGGMGTIPYGISEIRTRDGTPLYIRQGEGLGRIVEPWAIATMNTLLAGVIERGTGTAAKIGRPQAGKTGTSGDYRDAWFLGYTADYVGGVWVGNDDNTPMKKVTGGATPARIWKEVMLAAHQGLPAHPLPSGEDLDPLTRLFRSVFGDGAPSASAPEAAPAPAPTPAPVPTPAAPAAPAPSGSIGGIPLRTHSVEELQDLTSRN